MARKSEVTVLAWRGGRDQSPPARVPQSLARSVVLVSFGNNGQASASAASASLVSFGARKKPPSTARRNGHLGL